MTLGGRVQRWTGFEIWVTATLGGYVLGLLLLLLSVAGYVRISDFADFLRHPDLRAALRLSLTTATLASGLSILTALPTAYGLSRSVFIGRRALDTLVDVPLVLPPLVMGIALLVFFRTPIGRAIESVGLRFTYRPAGIVLAQFLIVTPYAVRTIKAGLDGLDRRLEDVARTLGATPWQTFRLVTLPQIRSAVAASAILTWAQAMGLFGPMMVFSGTMRGKTEVLATSIYLELSIGRIRMAMAIALFLIGVSLTALFLFKSLVGDHRRGWPW